MLEPERTINVIIGLIALLPLATLILCYILELIMILKVILTFTISLSTAFGILKLAQPLADEMKADGRLK